MLPKSTQMEILKSRLQEQEPDQSLSAETSNQVQTQQPMFIL